MQVGSIIRPAQEKKAAWSWYDSSHISFRVHHHAVIQLLYVYEVLASISRATTPSLGYAAQVLAVELGGKKGEKVLFPVAIDDGVRVDIHTPVPCNLKNRTVHCRKN